MPATDTSATFSVATFNLRGVMDRWQERQPLLRQCLRQIDADVLCFQECLTGEFGQERRLLPPWYHVFPCKAALFNLARAGGMLRWYAQAVERLLSVAPLRRAMVTLPPAVEAWRERLHLRSDVFRSLRDLAMAPFFGNSVACRIAEAHEIKHSTLVLGDWRAAQRIEFFIGRNGTNGREQAGGGGQQHGHQQRQTRRWRRRGRHLDGGSDSNGSSGDVPPPSPPAVNLSSQGGGRSSSAGQAVRVSLDSSGSSCGSGGASEASSGQRRVVSGEGGFKVWVVNTHLDHEHPDNRQRQALAVCDWMDREKADCAAILLCGDFNGAPHEPFHFVLRRLGYVSAHAARHGREPRGTWPTGIQAPLMDRGDFECLDYVYVWTAPDYEVKVLSADVFGLQPAEHDKTLFPSDHAAVKATIEVRRKVPVDLQGAQQAAQGQQGQVQAKQAPAPVPLSSL